MNTKRIGQQTIELPLRPALCGNAAFVGKKEGEGPLGACFDRVAEDELYGQETFELAEKQLYLDAIRSAIQKGGSAVEEVQFLLGGDLLNQIITASFSARDLGIPYIGLYGACSTMAESLCLAGMLLDGEHATQVVCAASSHFCTAERQYRFPLEFGNQRTPTAQWTVTGAGASLLSLEPKSKPLARISRVCMGRVVDMGITDANNMGAAMAPVGVNIGPSQLRGGFQGAGARHVDVNLGPYARGTGAGWDLKRRWRNDYGRRHGMGGIYTGYLWVRGDVQMDVRRIFRKKEGGGSAHGDVRVRGRA